jgi:acyl-CoA synthetase (AMP-forming)/AMP-acid ligase II
MSPDLMLDRAFSQAVEHFGDRTAIVDGPKRVTYADLGSLVARVASGLTGLGVAKGDRLAMWLPNSLEWVATFFAAMRLGAVVVPVNTGLSIDEARYLLEQSRSSTLVLPNSYRGRDYLRDASELVAVPGSPQLKLVVVGDDTRECAVAWSDLADSDAGGQPPRRLSPDDPTVILYTSGTTGLPKGAVHSHRFLAPLLSAGRQLRLDGNDSVVLYLPLYHVFGLLAGMVMMLLSGAKVVLMSQFDPAGSLALIETERATLVFGVPTTYADQLAVAGVEGYDLAGVRAAVTPFPADLCHRVSERFGFCLNTYGMTETASIAFLASLDDPQATAIDSVGYPVDGLEVKLVDEATSRPMPVGRPGALLLRGPSFASHYFDKPEETARSRTRDGWFRTGDLASLDEAGQLYFHGRQSDQLRVGGEMVDPVEIEVAIQSHPDVERAAVAGVPDDRLGHVPYAWVQLRRGSECDSASLAEHVAPRLAWFKRPRQVIIVESLPTTPSGKIQKFLLLESLRATP